MEQYRVWVMVILVIAAIGFSVAAFQEETFRAWNFGQAAVVCAVLALVVKR